MPAAASPTRDVVVRNGRVRVGYQIGGLAGAEVVIHLIGERPGTGLNTLSAYLTYGRDAARPAAMEPAARSLRYYRDLRNPSARQAATGRRAEIVATVGRILAQQRSGVALTA